MKGITYEMRRLKVGGRLIADSISRDGIYVIARRLKIKVSVEKRGSLFCVTRVDSGVTSLPELRRNYEAK